ncbi:MAG: hypothetical protein ABIK85_08635 [Candidatus Eisenbacteria bacterium]
MTDADGNTTVIEADFSRPSESRFTLRRTHFCRHLPCEIDENARTVTCTLCGAVLDPFAVLVQIAVGQRTVRNYEREAAALVEKINGLKAEVKRAKAAKRRAEGNP